jgi:hypothetical protein
MTWKFRSSQATIVALLNMFKNDCPFPWETVFIYSNFQRRATPVSLFGEVMGIYCAVSSVLEFLQAREHKPKLFKDIKEPVFSFSQSKPF